MAEDIFIKRIGSAAQSWLNYISAVDRDYILSESSIKLPLSELIGTRIERDLINLELPHPNFLKKRIDLHCVQQYNAVDYECAYEFKFIKGSSTRSNDEKQRIVNDLLRLHTFINTGNNRKAYFLICGTQHDFTYSFQSIQPNRHNFGGRRFNTISLSPLGYYTDLFKFGISPSPGRIIQPNNTQKDYHQHCTDFETKYRPPYLSNMGQQYNLPNRLKTRLIFISEDNTVHDVPTKMKVAIWEIQK